jgi:uncharacterized delta-60 repeat protein
MHQIKRLAVTVALLLRESLIWIIVAWFACWPMPYSALASAGDLDTSFGNSGKVNTSFSGLQDEASALAVQPDGKIVAAGTAFVGASQGNLSFGFALSRYNNDGSLDSSFGTQGKITTHFFGINDQALEVAIQSDGKIIAAGFTFLADASRRSVCALARYNSDGSLDPSFGSGGKVTTDFGADTAIFDIAIQSDGKIVAAVGNHFIVARYNMDGSLDTSFGVDGKIDTHFIGDFTVAKAVAIQRDGKIVAVGYDLISGVSTSFAIARYNSDGSFDASFGSAGKVVTSFSRLDEGRDIAIQSDGKIIIAGDSFASNSSDFALLRYNSDGSLDTSFGSGGRLLTDFFGSNDGVEAIAVQPGGKIVAVGHTENTANLGHFSFAVAQYNEDGSLDDHFGTAGRVITNFGLADSFPFAVALQADSKIVAAGYALNTAMNREFAIARYLSNIPQILNASIKGKKLIVSGLNFDAGAVVLLNGAKQKTANDEASPTNVLIAKKAAKKIDPRQAVRLQVRNSDGTLSGEFHFIRPASEP